jgi:hypothetical protein
MTNDAGIYFYSAKKFKSDIMFASLMHYGKIRKLPAATEGKKKANTGAWLDHFSCAKLICGADKSADASRPRRRRTKSKELRVYQLLRCGGVIYFAARAHK